MIFNLKLKHIQLILMIIKSFMIWRTKKAMIQKLLPQEPQNIEFEHWWIVHRTQIENEDLKVRCFI